MKIEEKLECTAEVILKTLGEKPADLDIILLGDGEMKRMKWRLMKKRTEPNVISFPEPKTFPHPERKRRYLGEIYLNKDILKKSPKRATPLLLHGILHLLGFDHIKPGDTKKMEKVEAEVLKELIRFNPS